MRQTNESMHVKIRVFADAHAADSMEYMDRFGCCCGRLFSLFQLDIISNLRASRMIHSVAIHIYYSYTSVIISVCV